MKSKTLNTTVSSTQSRSSKLAKFSSSFGLLTALVAASLIPHASTTAQQDPLSTAQMQPNFQLNVQRQAGTCPKTVGLWEFMIGVEGGADHTVVANTQAIASGSAKIVSSEKKRVVYEAPLRREYASCVGQASSPLLRAYNFQFRNGKVSFGLDVSQDDGYREILYKGVSANRPYLHWRAAE
ncbi:MAG TPA: hypothetical protein V6C91_21515 [Coleofasciculaceae cyanobacterium]